MRTLKAWMVIGAGLITTYEANAQFIRVDADLIVRPQAEWSQSQTTIEITPTTKMPNMHFELPYPADWTNVQATLMDGLKVRAEPTGNNEAYIELTWNQPGVLVYDLLLADGKCFGVSWRLPEGGWRAQGRIVYNPENNSIGWQEFAFVNEAVGTPTVNLGDCSLTPERTEQLTQDLLRQTVDPNWMQPLVRRAILEWAQVKKSTGTRGLMETLTLKITECVTLVWQPLEVRMLPSGMWRVPGQFILSHDKNSFDFGTVTRTESEAAIDAIKTNTLVIPLNTMEQVAAATARNRGFHGFVYGDEIPAFKQLFSNWKLQFLEWNDLLKFQPESKFLFHVGVNGPVTLSDRKTLAAGKKGLTFAQKTALLITVKAHINDDWFPYFDFKAVENGRADLNVAKSTATLHLTYPGLHLRSYLRDEFAQVRPAEPMTNMDRLNARFTKIFHAHDFSFDLPRWQLGNGHEMTLDGIAAETKSLRLPLAIGAKSPLPYGSVLRIVDAP